MDELFNVGSRTRCHVNEQVLAVYWDYFEEIYCFLADNICSLVQYSQRSLLLYLYVLETVDSLDFMWSNSFFSFDETTVYFGSSFFQLFYRFYARRICGESRSSYFYFWITRVYDGCDVKFFWKLTRINKLDCKFPTFEKHSNISIFPSPSVKPHLCVVYLIVELL